MGATIITVLQGVQNVAANYSIDVNFEQGCYIDSTNTTLLQPAVKLASVSDLAIIVVSIQSSFNYPKPSFFFLTHRVMKKVGDSLSTCQESWGGRTGDRPDLDLSGGGYRYILIYCACYSLECSLRSTPADRVSYRYRNPNRCCPYQRQTPGLLFHW